VAGTTAGVLALVWFGITPVVLCTTRDRVTESYLSVRQPPPIRADMRGRQHGQHCRLWQGYGRALDRQWDEAVRGKLKSPERLHLRARHGDDQRAGRDSAPFTAAGASVVSSQ
jgi:hypothetical protein